MSRLQDAENALKTKLQAKLPAFNIFTKLNPEGYTSPYLLLTGYYDVSDRSTDNKSRQERYRFDILMGVDYSCIGGTGGETEEEALRDAIETILSLSLFIPDQQISIFDAKNSGNNTKITDFTVIQN